MFSGFFHLFINMVLALLDLQYKKIRYMSINAHKGVPRHNGEQLTIQLKHSYVVNLSSYFKLIIFF